MLAYQALIASMIPVPELHLDVISMNTDILVRIWCKLVIRYMMHHRAHTGVADRQHR